MINYTKLFPVMHIPLLLLLQSVVSFCPDKWASHLSGLVSCKWASHAWEEQWEGAGFPKYKFSVNQKILMLFLREGIEIKLESSLSKKKRAYGPSGTSNSQKHNE